MLTRSLLPAVLATSALAIAACGSDGDGGGATAGGGPRVVATTTIAGDLARNVAGDRAAVATILPANADPHDYEPRPSDAKAVAEAALVIRSGGDLDAWLGDVVENAGGDTAEVTLMDGVRTRAGGHDHEAGAEHDGEETDPHWWQDPANAVLAVEAIRAALVEADPEGAATYDRNAKAYTEQLERLDAAIAACMRGIPAARRKLVTNHDAFAYFADRYDVEVVGTVIPSLSTRSQASAGEVTDLVRTIREEDVRTIFAENTVNQRLERAIADRAGAQVGPPLWSDSLGDADSTGATYLDMLRFNAGALADGFTGREGACDLAAQA